ncbi:AraC family transcriptional regulator [Halosquirtibacter laminarini]|uniref:AraC family transcriptional regulator n=1 Tax=Halosquirtibacter laminarini TaxID=3374600 RepID=A0AC61NPN0_9BACT|nr:AraC family transcriptional regulator [Prolixibacteraceae bacterium]
MKSILKSDQFREKVRVKYHKDGFDKPTFEDTEIVYSEDHYHTKLRGVSFNGLKMTMREDSFEIPLKMEVEHDFHFLKLHFEMEGSSLYIPKNSGSTMVDIPGGHYNFFFLPKVKGELHYKPKYRRTLEIIFSENYINNYFQPILNKQFKEFARKMKDREPVLLFEKSRIIPNHMKDIIEQIIRCDFPNELKEVYFISKINELISNFLYEAAHSVESEVPNEIINAKEILKKEYDNPPTILLLSRRIGINQSKLKKDFKYHFNKTIYAFITETRMQIALLLIKRNQSSIAEISHHVGYKNPQHFTVAFKKYFGYLPSEQKRRNLLDSSS